MPTDVFQKKHRWVMGMDPELSLAPPSFAASPLLSQALLSSKNSGASVKDPDETGYKKRKRDWDSLVNSQQEYCNLYDTLRAQKIKFNDSGVGIELHLKSPLPLDWEQCLDLKSGQMYYINRNTQTKTWNDPREQLDLELGISSVISENCKNYHPRDQQEGRRKSSKSTEMIAIACMQCHMFVMLSKDSPSCPNCKHVHSLDPESTAQGEGIHVPIRKTLSLLD
eukprot:Gb_35362 [translate_table: standard]